jgi:hypothetical protein
MADRIGGIIRIKVDGTQYNAKGNFSYRINPAKKEMVVGSDEVHGYKEMPQVPFIEGAITDRSQLDVQALQSVVDATITLELANGKVIVLREAVYASEGAIDTEEGEIEARFEGISGEEIR